MTHQKKESANTNRQLADEDIKLFKGLTHCHHCGGFMVRRMDARMEHPVTWKCPRCGYFLPLPDEDFKQRVFLLQKKLVEKPLLAEKEEESSAGWTAAISPRTSWLPLLCNVRRKTITGNKQRPTHYR